VIARVDDGGDGLAPPPAGGAAAQQAEMAEKFRKHLRGTLSIVKNTKVSAPFLRKLWHILVQQMLDYPEAPALSWDVPAARAFTIHPDPRRGKGGQPTYQKVREVLAMYFKSNNMDSFQRQLNYFGFAKVGIKPDEAQGTMRYMQRDFQAYDPAAIGLIKRKENTGNAKKKKKKNNEIALGLAEDGKSWARRVGLAPPRSQDRPRSQGTYDLRANPKPRQQEDEEEEEEISQFQRSVTYASAQTPHFPCDPMLPPLSPPFELGELDAVELAAGELGTLGPDATATLSLDAFDMLNDLNDEVAVAPPQCKKPSQRKRKRGRLTQHQDEALLELARVCKKQGKVDYGRLHQLFVQRFVGDKENNCSVQSYTKTQLKSRVEVLQKWEKERACGGGGQKQMGGSKQ